MFKVIKNSYSLFKGFDFFLLKKKSLFILIGQHGSLILKMPKIFFFKSLSKDEASLIFINNFFFQSFLKNFHVFYNRLYFYYFFRLKLKGRGYRIKRLSGRLYRFYFIRVNYFYLHVPSSVVVRLKRKRILFLSFNFCILQMIKTYLLLLKGIHGYRKRGFLYPKNFIIMKPGKKRI